MLQVYANLGWGRPGEGARELIGTSGNRVIGTFRAKPDGVWQAMPEAIEDPNIAALGIEEHLFIGNKRNGFPSVTSSPSPIQPKIIMETGQKK
jgi:hypothetical protein